MKEQREKTGVNPFTVILIIIIFLIICMVFSCTGSKEVEKTKIVIDSSYALKYDSLQKKSSETIQHLQSQLTEARKTQVKFKDVPCPPIPKIDSGFCKQDSLVNAYNRLVDYVNSLKNKVTVLANGSIVYEGQITKFKSDFGVMQNHVYDLQTKLTDSVHVIDSLKHQLSITESQLKSNKKHGWPFWIWMLIGSAITCVIIYRKNIRKFILSLIKI